jgi:hypothetical protein
MKSVIILVAIAAMSLQPATTTVAGNPLNESSNLNETSVLTQPDSTFPLTLQYAAPQPGMFFLIGGGLLSVSAVLRRRRKN